MGFLLTCHPKRPWHKRLAALALGAALFSQTLAGQTTNASTAGSTPPAASSPLPPTPAPAPAPLPPTASSTSTAAMLNSMDALNNETKLNKRDVISYRVIEERQDPIVRNITDSGELDVPLLGRYPAAGKTCKQLASELKPLLEKDYFYKATVIIGIETISPLSMPTPTPPPPLGKVYFMGYVAKQGAMELPPNESLTLSKALLLNGGLADFADRHKVKVMRKKADGSSDIIIVDYADIVDNGDSKKDLVLQNGDIINVQEKLINF